MLSRDRAAILLLSVLSATIGVACSPVDSLWRSNKPTEPDAVFTTPSPVAQSPSDPPPTATLTDLPQLDPKETYERALDVAYSATSIGQSAQSPDDWGLVITRWQEAIALLTEIPSESNYHAKARQKIAEYQNNLNTAKQRASRPRPPSPPSQVLADAPRIITQPGRSSRGETPSPSPPETELDTPETELDTPETAPETTPASPASSQVFKAPIVRRIGRTPVVEVTINGTQTFEMVVDTGSSGTVITQEMAQSLAIVPEGEVTADTASARGVKLSTGKAQSIAVGGAVAKNIQVAIGSPELEIGLLGQDFFGNYDVWIRENIVEFHPR